MAGDTAVTRVPWLPTTANMTFTIPFTSATSKATPSHASSATCSPVPLLTWTCVCHLKDLQRYVKKSLGFQELIQPLLISPTVWNNLLLVCPPSVSLNCTNPTESKMVFEHQAQSFCARIPGSHLWFWHGLSLCNMLPSWDIVSKDVVAWLQK